MSGLDVLAVMKADAQAAADHRYPSAAISADEYMARLGESAQAHATVVELIGMVTRYASECGECEGRGYVVRYCDPYGHGDVASTDHHDCPDCADIRALIAKATQA